MLSPFKAKFAAVIITSFSVFFASVGGVHALPAFPGAEGFGAETIGGRGGKVYEVINLNDSGAGSLRDCINATGARICIFKVGGIIQLNSGLVIANPFITVAGQTAPGGGITLRNNSHVDPLLDIETHDVVVRYLTLRPKVTGSSSDEFDAMGIWTNNGRTPAYNIIVDHCSLSWGTDQIMGSWYGPHDFSVQWSLFAEGLSYSTHSKGRHSKGPMFGSYTDSEGGGGIGAYNVSFHHNLIANNEERNPLMKGGGIMDVVNNVGFNPFESGGQGSFGYIDIQAANAIMKQNWVGNFYKSPPGAAGKAGLKSQSVGGQGLQVYVKGNIGPTRTSSSTADSAFVDSGTQGYIVSTRFSAPTVTTYACNSSSDCEAYNKVLAGSGNYQGIDANGNWYARRDAVDKRVIEGVKGTRGFWGKIIDAPGASTCKGICRGGSYVLTAQDYTKYGINDQLDADLWPVIAGGAAYVDSDHDGMPDNWEGVKGLNVNDASDASKDKDGDGYSNLEEFLNGTDPASGGTPPPGTKTGDVNADGKVDIVDIGILIDNYGKSPIPNPKADINRDGNVDIVDIGIIIDNYGK